MKSWAWLALFLVFFGVAQLGCDSVLDGDERIMEGTKLVASDGTAQINFGSDVAVSGDHAIVSARDGRVAYFFEREGVGWVETQVVRPGQNTPNFGISVGIDGEFAIVGGDGFVHVYQRQAAGWVEVAGLRPSNRDVGIFGRSVAISGNVALVGAPSALVNDLESGAVLVYEWIDSDWQEVGAIQPQDPEEGDDFGHALAIHGDYAIIGAPGKRTPNESAGAAYIFKRGEEDWVFSSKLRNGTYDPISVSGNSYFGNSVDISENFAVVGNVVFEAASVFQKQGSVWLPMGTLVPATDPDPSTLDSRSGFAQDVAISESHIVVGAFGWPVVESGSDEGAAFLYRREGAGWGDPLLLTADEPASQDRFGVRVALDGGVAMVGAPTSDDQGIDSGSAYMFDL